MNAWYDISNLNNRDKKSLNSEQLDESMQILKNEINI